MKHGGQRNQPGCLTMFYLVEVKEIVNEFTEFQFGDIDIRVPKRFTRSRTFYKLRKTRGQSFQKENISFCLHPIW